MTGTRIDEMTTGVGGTVGNARALELFVGVHYDRLIGLAGLVCGELGSAEDIVQTALERARLLVNAGRGSRGSVGWCGHPPSRRSRFPSASSSIKTASRFPDRTAIRVAVDGLTRAQRAVVVLTLHAGYSIDQTAGILGIPWDTVRSRLRVAREHLRMALGEGE